jgi:hypothetical protein
MRRAGSSLPSHGTLPFPSQGNIDKDQARDLWQGEIKTIAGRAEFNGTIIQEAPGLFFILVLIK